MGLDIVVEVVLSFVGTPLVVVAVAVAVLVDVVDVVDAVDAAVAAAPVGL